MTEQMDITWIPEPKSIRWLKGRFTWDGIEALVLSQNGDDRLRRWAESLRDEIAQRTGHHLAIRMVPAMEPGVWLAATADGDAISLHFELPESPEGYVLQITPGTLVVAARRPPGLYYGLQTLRQIIDTVTAAGETTLPAVQITDWPDLALRGIHLDLKGGMAPFSYWREVITTLAHYKINAVLIEYEDKFPYTSHPDIVGPGALTRDEIAQLVELAREHCVEIIPLVQCLGHVQYVLRHERYAHLREAGDLSQYCPLEPGAAELFREMADEVIAAHPHSRYFHLGADETWVLGKCPRCREFVEREGKLALYMSYVVPAIEYVRSRGKTPIIWDDMIWRTPQPDKVDQIPPDTVMCDWFYHITEPKVPYFLWGDETDMSRRWISRRWKEIDPTVFSPRARPLEELPEAGQAFARKYWDRGDWPLMGDSLPYVNFFKELGRPVIGASAAKGADGFAAFCPNFDLRYRNVTFWGKAAAEKGIEGVISTAWARYSTLTVPCEPFEMGWYTYLASAEAYWNGGSTQRVTFDAAFDRQFIGASGVSQAIRHLDRGRSDPRGNGLTLARELLSNAETQASEAGKRYIAHLRLAVELAELHARAKDMLGMIIPSAGRVARGEPTREAERAAQYIEGVLANFDSWQQTAEEVLTQTLLPADAAEVIEAQTFGWKEILAGWNASS
ncbi:MAG: beta-N-acetylhexosaminidase [Anaerolineae bacterium]|nr:beta-N-acetylhexosaminidase [Anaerolineae bacterium]